MPRDAYPISQGETIRQRLVRDIQVMRKWSVAKKTVSTYLRRNLEIRRTGVGESLLIVANGPSAERLPTGFVGEFRAQGGSVMGMNWAHLNPALAGAGIDYYLSADRRMVENSEKASGLMKYLKEQKPIFGFVPEMRIQKWEEILPEISFIPFCHYYIKYLRMPWWGLSPLHPKAFTAHSGLHALQMATWLGFDRVFIVGFDNSYVQEFSVTAENRLRRGRSHAGEETETFFSDGNTVNFLERQAMLFRDYWLFCAEPVWNLDLESLTDAFEKMNPARVSSFLRGGSPAITKLPL